MYNCAVCYKCFTHEGNLQAHVRAVHFGEKRQRRANRFVCELCHKSLCSKRSYDEHKNTHFNSRPFKCRMCQYAAASQMTLRRHTLRQHVHKSGWHYQCPYCLSAFVEPTSYQGHLQHKHPQLSGTFGCDSCDFSTLSSKTFLDHLEKHGRGEILDNFTGQPRFLKKPFEDDLSIREYLIEDELGRGYDDIEDSAYHSLTEAKKLREKNANLLIGRTKYDHGYHNNEPSEETGNLHITSVVKQPNHDYYSSDSSSCSADDLAAKNYNKHTLKIKRSAEQTTRIKHQAEHQQYQHYLFHYVPEPCFQIEISSSSSSSSSSYNFNNQLLRNEKFGTNQSQANQLHKEKSTSQNGAFKLAAATNQQQTPNDLGMHVLPDGQVDFDLD